MNRRTALGAAAVAALSSGVFADISLSYISPSDFEYEATHMPDFDQVREFLGDDDNGNPGGMYCVPASIANLMGYIGTHGFSNMPLGAADWENEEDYLLVTVVIEELASRMNTDPASGTGGFDGRIGTISFLKDFEPGKFNVTLQYLTPTSTIMVDEIAQGCYNGIASFGFGFYRNFGMEPSGRNLWFRVGGHSVSLAGAVGNGSTTRIQYRDPADSNIETTQSTFMTTDNEVNLVTFVNANSTFNAMGLGTQSAHRLVGGGLRIIDGAMFIRPRGYYNWENQDRTFHRYYPGDVPIWTEIPDPFPGPLELTVMDFNVDPIGTTMWYLAEETPTQAHSIRMATQEARSIALPHRAERLAFARDNALVVLGGGRLTRLHPFAAEGSDIPGPLSVAVPTSMKFMDMDDDRDAIWLAGPTSSSVHRVSQKFDGALVSMGLPAGLGSIQPIDGLATGGSAGASVAILASGQVFICEVPEDGAGDPNWTPSLVATDHFLLADDAESIQFNDEGDLLVSGADGLALYRSNDGAWQQVENPVLPAEFIPGVTKVTRSRTNFEEALHGDWKQLNPSEFEQMASDLNHDGRVDIEDLLDLLAVFGTQSSDGDLDADGTVGINDLLILLSNWTV